LTGFDFVGAVLKGELEMTTDTNQQPQTVHLGDVPVSRFMLGGNPFSGFAHQTRERDLEMVDWYTMERIKEACRLAEAAGVTTHLGRVDNFTLRLLREHRNESGTLNWVAQTCPFVTTLDIAVSNAVEGGAAACFIHGGDMDYRVANGKTQEVVDAVKRIRDEGMAVGAAGHRCDTVQWAADHLDLDFFMCCYYNPDDRRLQTSRDYESEEDYRDEDRQAMCALIQTLPKPAIHYKVLAAGRNDPKDAFEVVAQAYRPGDAVCVGIFTKENADMIQEDVNLLETALAARGK
jgi:hypothetical protein